RFVASDGAGNQTPPVSFAFTLDTTPPASPALDLGAGSASGDHQTSAARVVLVGQTDPNASVALVETGATTVANNAGVFQFTDVPVAEGTNVFHARASDVAGNTSSATTTITRAAGTAQGDVVLFWNQAALDAIETDSSDPAVASRSLAIVQSAVYDA